jgi:hypothetical protein
LGIAFSQSTEHLSHLYNLTDLQSKANVDLPLTSFPNLKKLILTSTAPRNIPFFNNTLTHLTVSSHIGDVVNYLPPSIIKLRLLDCFNQPVDHLPPNVITLEFGVDFNQPINNIPQSVVYLHFGYYFEQRISSWPKMIRHATFHDSYEVEKLTNIPSNVAIHFIS